MGVNHYPFTLSPAHHTQRVRAVRTRVGELFDALEPTAFEVHVLGPRCLAAL